MGLTGWRQKHRQPTKMRCLSYSALPTSGSIILLLLLSSLFVTSFAFRTFDYLDCDCNNASTYSDGSIYWSNLNTVLNYLIQNGSRSGFNSSSFGQSLSKVYGFIQCFGNISAKTCYNCSSDARSRLQTLCPNTIDGRIWMTYCYLRYDNYSFVSKLDTTGKYLVNPDEIGNDAEAFKSVKFELLSNLSKIASKPASNGFAIGSANYTASKTVYGLVQCWRDISSNDCYTCLQGGVNLIDSTRIGAHALFGSCTVRYENYNFYKPADWPPSTSPSSSPPPPPPATTASQPPNYFPPPPPPPTTASQPPNYFPPPPNSASQPPNSSPPADTPANGTLPHFEPRKNSSTLPIIMGTLGGVIFVIVICLIALRRKFISTFFGEPMRAVADHKETGLLSEEGNFLFSLETLIEATQNFHPDNKLGEGGFGAVYRGTTKDGKDIAVKKLSLRSSQGKKEFMNEVKLVADIRHRNLVKLLGCCVEGDERLLVYEYLPNKSLDNFLFDPEKRKHLDWEKRYNIIIGIARGLLYLHEDSQLRIIHRDIKANNILLDDKLNPKIADFGLARLFPEDKTYIQTRVAGTYGYLAPEYAMKGHLSVKVDVYSFGVLLLEIVSGRKNTENHDSQEMQSLLEWLWRLYKRDDVLSIVDSMVIQNCPEEQAQRCIHAGLLCVQAEASLRPTMFNVLMMISSNLVTSPNLAKPAFVNSGQSLSPEYQPEHAREASSGTSGTSTQPSSGLRSVNDTSVSELNAR